MTIEESIKQAIKRSGLTLSAIETLSGVSRANLRHFVSGERTITLTTADRLARALGCKITVDLPKRKG